MRILVICGAGYVSGKEKIMLSMLKGFKEQGDEVHCITSSWGNGQFENLLINEKIGYSKARLGFISKTFNWQAIRMTLDQVVYLPALLFRYKKVTRNFRPEVVIHTNFHHLFLLYPVVRSRYSVQVYHSHESIAASGFYKKLFGLFDKKIAIFVSVSGYVQQKLAALGIGQHKLKTIHNGLEIIKLPARNFKTGHLFTVGIVGQVGSWKGHEDLVNAAAILQEKNPALKFNINIFGEGQPAFTSQLENMIAVKELKGLVKWKGFVNSIEEIYGELDVVCIPSRSEEPFATSALEAGLFAVPVIVSNRGGFPEMVEHERSGFIVEANNPEQIAGRLELLINNPSLATATGLQHRENIVQRFSYPQFIAKWRSLLQQLIAARS